MRTPLLLALACVAVVATRAQASERVVSPVLGGTACVAKPPVVLTAGKAPRTPLRFQLATMAGTSHTAKGVDVAVTTVLDADGTSSPGTTTTTNVSATTTAGAVAHGLLPTKTVVRVSGTPYPKPVRTTITGSTDILGGGQTAGTPDNDHFPREAIGIGATWRVVNCDLIGQIHAKETRTYTLRAVRRGVAVLSSVDAISLDPAHVDLGTTTQGGVVGKLRLDTLTGSATGTTSITFRGSLTATSRRVTTLHASISATAASGQKARVRLTLVDTKTLS